MELGDDDRSSIASRWSLPDFLHTCMLEYVTELDQTTSGILYLSFGPCYVRSGWNGYVRSLPRYSPYTRSKLL